MWLAWFCTTALGAVPLAAVRRPLFNSSFNIQHSSLLMSERGSFGTKIGVILATAGSAVGLGNIWRFPYLTGQDGGAAFLLVYLVSILILGIPGMVAEFIVGRHGASNAARAYYQLGGRWWSLIGYMGAVTSMIILGFYAVVADGACNISSSPYWEAFMATPLMWQLISRTSLLIP